MSNGQQMNCILEVCCDLVRAKTALAAALAADGLDPQSAAKAAAYVLDHFDLARRGTLAAFKADVARLARERL